MLQQLSLAKCSLAHTYTNLKLFFFSPRETVVKSLIQTSRGARGLPAASSAQPREGYEASELLQPGEGSREEEALLVLCLAVGLPQIHRAAHAADLAG